MVYDALSNKKILNLIMIKYLVLKRKGLQEQVASSANSFHMAYNKNWLFPTDLECCLCLKCVLLNFGNNFGSNQTLDLCH